MNGRKGRGVVSLERILDKFLYNNLIIRNFRRKGVLYGYSLLFSLSFDIQFKEI